MQRGEWFSHDRFGMFVHWGLYSNPAGVWNGKKNKHPYSEWLQASEEIPRLEYRKLAETFNPVNFGAEAWIREAKNAGMEYFIITSKHHDGFALWPSKASSYNVMDATPFKRDILGELAAACRKFDVKLGLYYSHWQDWDGTGGDVRTGGNSEYVRPSEAEFDVYWRKKCLPQVRELIENYDPWILWFDTWGDASFEHITEERQDELISLVHGLSGKCMVNSRIQFLKPSDKVDCISTMDNSFPAEGFAKPWETSGTLNHSWAFHAMDFEWKSTRQLLGYLIGNASLGGNYQLNVGPMGDGRFQAAATKRLREIGAWLAVNGESIYGTQAGLTDKMPWGRITSRPLEDGRTRLYLHLLEFTPGTALFIKGLSGDNLSAKVLESGQKLTAESGSSGTWVNLPEELKGLDLPVVALDIRIRDAALK